MTMPRMMLFRALVQLSDPDRFELLCNLLDNITFVIRDNEVYKELAEAGLVLNYGFEPYNFHGVTKIGKRLIDAILDADDWDDWDNKEVEECQK